MNPVDMTAAPHPRFPVQGHILSTSGGALTREGRRGSQIEYQYYYYYYY
jgi:hypothetical protein